MNNKQFRSDLDCYHDEFRYEFLQFKRRFKYKFGVSLNYCIDLIDEDGDVIKSLKSKSPELKQG